jgi:hypoxanthine-guanine phosphoribosyltransferase
MSCFSGDAASKGAKKSKRFDQKLLARAKKLEGEKKLLLLGAWGGRCMFVSDLLQALESRVKAQSSSR